MFEQGKSRRDAFAISLGGMTTIASFVVAPAVAHDRINRIRDERRHQAGDARDQKPRGWFWSRRQAAQNCA